MSINQKTLNALKILGLTDYEIQAYIATMSLISATATEISLESKVPRSKVYVVLKSLSKKGFVEIINGKPLKFNVIPPKEVFEKSRDYIKEQLDEAENELSFIYQDQIPNVPAPIWLINGAEKNLKKEMEIISRAKESIFILEGLMFKGEAPLLKDKLEKTIKKGVHVRAIINESYENEEADITKEIDKLNLELKITKTPFIKLIIRDKKEMLITFCKIKENKPIPNTAMGIWNQYNEFVEMIDGVYNYIWTTELLKKID